MHDHTVIADLFQSACFLLNVGDDVIVYVTSYWHGAITLVW